MERSKMDEPTAKGTVTSLSSMIPVEDAQKAVKRVQDTLAEKQQELERVKEFIVDNANLINLVQKLPEELHHDIMVPFGKAAFFPGRLIHTNEFLVLLGEGYYADRTSKQTVEILKRRGKVLVSQLDSLKAMMKDLQAEASFFDRTASEAAEGLLEIREEYVEENLSAKVSESGLLKEDSPSLSEASNLKAEDEDEEYARIMSRLDELEKEELAAEIENGSGENKQNNASESDNEDDDEHAKSVFDQFSDQLSLDHNLRHPEGFESSNTQRTKKKVTFEEFANNYNHQQDFADQSCTGLAVPAVFQDAKSQGKSLANNVTADAAEKSLRLPEVKEDAAAASSSRKEIPAQTSKPGFNSDKAFTGSIIEHPNNIQTNPQGQSGTSSKPSISQPSKPVSRFRMQRK